MEDRFLPDAAAINMLKSTIAQTSDPCVRKNEEAVLGSLYFAQGASQASSGQIFKAIGSDIKGLAAFFNGYFDGIECAILGLFRLAEPSANAASNPPASQPQTTTFNTTFTGTVSDDGTNSPSSAGTASLNGSGAITVTAGNQYVFGGSVQFTQGAGIPDDYGGTYNVVGGQVSNQHVQSVTLQGPSATIVASFTSGTWSFAQKVNNADFGSGTFTAK